MFLSSPEGVGAGGSAGPQPVACWGGGLSERKPCPTDLSHGHWSLAEPLTRRGVTGTARSAAPRGAYAMREIVNAILYQDRTGCQWGLLPARPAAEERDVLLLRRLAGRRD